MSKEFAAKIRTDARRSRRRGNVDEAARRQEIDRQVSDLADTICEVGRSNIQTAKLQGLEEERLRLSRYTDKSRISDLVNGTASQWRATLENLENLGKVAKPDEMEDARSALREIIGEIKVVEENNGVLAYPRLSENAVCRNGAEDPLPDLYIEPIRLK